MTAPRITGHVVGVAQVTDALQGASVDRRANVARAIQRSGIELSNWVKAKKLTGQVLNVRTGRLRASINDLFEDDGDEVSSTVGTSVPYGRFWELGFVGVVTVRSFVRRVKSRNKFTLGSRSRDNGRRKRIMVAEGIAYVESHQRRITEPARPFLTPSLQEMRSRILERLAKAVGGQR